MFPELISESDPKGVVCSRPVGNEDRACGLPDQPSDKRLSADEFLQVPALLPMLARTSPKGPPIELPPDIGIRFGSEITNVVFDYRAHLDWIEFPR